MALSTQAATQLQVACHTTAVKPGCQARVASVFLKVQRPLTSQQSLTGNATAQIVMITQLKACETTAYTVLPAPQAGTAKALHTSKGSAVSHNTCSAASLV